MAEKKHIFLVEDELHLRHTLTLILRQAGFRVTAIDNGERAFDLIREISERAEKIDLLVTDVEMPGMNGTDIIDNLRKIGIQLPCLVITGFGNNAALAELISRGCTEHLDKPFEPEEFLERVRFAIEKEELKKNGGRRK